MGGTRAVNIWHWPAHLTPADVPALAAQAGLSEARFKVRFKEEVGIPPGEYVLRARVDEARKLGVE